VTVIGRHDNGGNGAVRIPRLAACAAIDGTDLQVVGGRIISSEGVAAFLRTGPGVYTITLESALPAEPFYFGLVPERGMAQATLINADNPSGLAVMQTLRTGADELTVFAFDLAGVPVNAAFYLAVWSYP
jgi:hypothetical protein